MYNDIIEYLIYLKYYTLFYFCINDIYLLYIYIFILSTHILMYNIHILNTYHI